MISSISLGPLTIHLYGLIIAAAIYWGLTIAKKRASLYQIPKSFFEDPVIVLPIALGIVGGRLYHIIDYWNFYKNDPVSITYIWNGGLGILGAIAGSIFGFWIAARIKKVDFVRTLDALAAPTLLAQAIGRFGNWVNQEGFGPPTDLPWGIYIDPAHRPFRYQSFTYFHPTFFYEAALDFIFFLILLRVSRKLRVKGQSFALYLILYSIGRFIVEFFRIDTATLGPIKAAHFFSVLIFAAGLLIFLRKRPLHPE